jgi:DNA-directed RNA polymerase subunit RPC12/RpoP
MDNRCPVCGKDLGRRKLAHSIVARMDVDCPHCGGGLSVHVHPAERILVLAGAGGALALAVLSYLAQSQALLLAALLAGMAAAGAMSMLDRIWLRDWPRYVPRRLRRGME